MKYFLFTLLFYFSSCFYISLLSQEDDPNRYTNEHLRNLGITPQGKVKSVEKFIYHYENRNGKEVKIFPKNAKIERTPVHSRYLFDQKGNIIEFYNYYTDGKLFQKILYQYNTDNLLTKADEYKYIEENNPQHIEEIFYEGKVMISKEYKIDGILSKVEMLFDKNKRKEAVFEYRNDTLINKKKYSYNSKGNITYDDKNISDKKTKYYIYDSKGAIVEIQIYKGKEFYSYHCMENDKEVESYSYFLEGEVRKTVYNKENKLIKEENFISGMYYTYDGKGNLIQISDKPTSSPNRTIYHYDKFNNCTEEIYYKNNKRVAIVERIFTYY